MATGPSGEGFWGRSVLYAWSSCGDFLKTRPQIQLKGSEPENRLTFGDDTYRVRDNDAQLWQLRSMFLPPRLEFFLLYTQSDTVVLSIYFIHPICKKTNAFWLHLCPWSPLLYIPLLCLWWLNKCYLSSATMVSHHLHWNQGANLNGLQRRTTTDFFFPLMQALSSLMFFSYVSKGRVYWALSWNTEDGDAGSTP